MRQQQFRSTDKHRASETAEPDRLKSGMPFKRGIHCINFLLSFCFFYCLLVFVYFNRYQAYPLKTLRGEAAFQPFVYLCSVCCFYILHQIFKNLKRVSLILLADAVVIGVSVYLFPIVGEKYLLGFALAFYVLTDFLILGNIEKRKDTEMELFFALKYAGYWGVGILLILIAHCITAEYESELPVTAASCTSILCVSLFVFLILFVIQKYAVYFYKHFYQKKAMNEVVKKQIMRVFAFVTLRTAAAGLAVFLLAAALTWIFAPYLSGLYHIFDGVLSFLGMSVNDSEYAFWFNSTGPDSSTFKEVIRQQGSRNRNDFLMPVIQMILLLLFVIAVLLIFFMIYKKLKNASVVPVAEEEDTIVRKSENEVIDTIRKKADVLPKVYSPNEKIRQSYRSLVSFKNKREKLNRLGKLTSGEIKESAAESPEEKALMEKITDTYDEVRYGDAVMDRQQANAFEAKCQEVKKLCKKMKGA